MTEQERATALADVIELMTATESDISLNRIEDRELIAVALRALAACPIPPADLREVAIKAATAAFDRSCEDREGIGWSETVTAMVDAALAAIQTAGYPLGKPERHVTPEDDECKRLSASISKKLLEMDTSEPWSVDMTEDEFHFVLGLLMLVESGDIAPEWAATSFGARAMAAARILGANEVDARRLAENDD